MKLKISFEEIKDAIESASFEHHYFIDKRKHEIVFISEHEDDYEKKLEEVESDNFIGIPTRMADDDFQIMKSFIWTIGNFKIAQKFDEALGLKIKVDVIGILKRGEDFKLVFVEIKDTDLTLKDLGQLWGYTQLIDPVESFLVTSRGIGRLSHLFNIDKREDLLEYGRKRNNFMRIAKWDQARKSVAWDSIIPKI